MHPNSYSSSHDTFRIGWLISICAVLSVSLHYTFNFEGGTFAVLFYDVQEVRALATPHPRPARLPSAQGRDGSPLAAPTTRARALSDWCENRAPIAAPLALVAVALTLTLVHRHTLSARAQLLWTFSIYLEAVAILPQLFLLQRTGECEALTADYVFLLVRPAPDERRHRAQRL